MTSPHFLLSSTTQNSSYNLGSALVYQVIQRGTLGYTSN